MMGFGMTPGEGEPGDGGVHNRWHYTPEEGIPLGQRCLPGEVEDGGSSHRACLVSLGKGGMDLNQTHQSSAFGEEERVGWGTGLSQTNNRRWLNQALTGDGLHGMRQVRAQERWTAVGNGNAPERQHKLLYSVGNEMTRFRY